MAGGGAAGSAGAGGAGVEGELGAGLSLGGALRALGPALRALGLLALRLSTHLTSAYCMASFVRMRGLALSLLARLLLGLLDFALGGAALAALLGGAPGRALAAVEVPLFLGCFALFSGPWGARAVAFWEASSLSVLISCAALLLGSWATMATLETIYVSLGPRAALAVGAVFCGKLGPRYAARWARAVRARAGGRGDAQKRSTEPRRLLERMTPSFVVNSQLAHALVAYAVYFPVRAWAGPAWARRAGLALDCADAALALVAFFGYGVRNPEDVYTGLVEGARALGPGRGSGRVPGNAPKNVPKNAPNLGPTGPAGPQNPPGNAPGSPLNPSGQAS